MGRSTLLQNCLIERMKKEHDNFCQNAMQSDTNCNGDEHGPDDIGFADNEEAFVFSSFLMFKDIIVS